MASGVSLGAKVMVLGTGFGPMHDWASGARTGRTVERHLGQVIEVGRVTGWAVASTTVLAVPRWAVLGHSRPSAMWLLVLGVPTLPAGVMVAGLSTSAGVWARPGAHP